MIDISRWNSPKENQNDEYVTAKYCQTYVLLNCLEHQINKTLCYKNKIKRGKAVNYLKGKGLNLSEIFAQEFAKTKYFGNPFNKEPVHIASLVKMFTEYKFPQTDYKISQHIKFDVSDKISLRYQIERCLHNRIPVYVGIKGRYRQEKIDGIWTQIYTQATFSLRGHALMIDGINEEGHFLCENSTATPRGIIEDIGCIKRCYAFEFTNK